MKIIMPIMLVLVSFSALAGDRKLGVGLSVGNPTGVNGKYWLSKDRAVDAGLGLSVGRHGQGSLHSDYLLHKKGALFFNDKHPLDLFFGIGGRMEFADELELGVRVPVGLAYQFENNQVDLFGEIAPILDFIGRRGIELHMAIGARYYF